MAEKPHREPAAGPSIPKAPDGHPARQNGEDEQHVTAPTTQKPPTSSEQDEPLVNYGGRVPKSLRQRARVFVASHEIEHQDFLAEAVREYLDRHGG